MLSERLALRRDLKIVCHIPLTEYRLDVVSTRSRHVLAYGWRQPHLDIQTTVRKTQRQPFVRLSSPPKNRLLEAPSSRSLFLGERHSKEIKAQHLRGCRPLPLNIRLLCKLARLYYSERGELCDSVPSLWPANSSLISSQASLWSSTDFFSFSPAGSSLRIASSISFRAFDCREKASDSSRGMSGPDCSCCAIS
jgi:hypothetical protein